MKSRTRESQWLVVGALPVAFLLVWLAKKIWLTRVLFEACRLWIHEFGHASIAWLSGHAATPLGIGWTNSSPDRSMVVFICFAFLIGLSIWKSVQKKNGGFVVVLGLIFLLQLYFTFGLNERQYETLMAYGGIGGELYLGALLVATFFSPYSIKGRWRAFRYPVLLIGAYSFLNTFLLWISISHHDASIPWGTLFFGKTDGNGDMNRLYHIAGWLKVEIIRVYIKTGTICALGLAVLYVGSLVRFFGFQRASFRKMKPKGA